MRENQWGLFSYQASKFEISQESVRFDGLYVCGGLFNVYSKIIKALSKYIPLSTNMVHCFMAFLWSVRVLLLFSINLSLMYLVCKNYRFSFWMLFREKCTVYNGTLWCILILLNVILSFWFLVLEFVCKREACVMILSRKHRGWINAWKSYISTVW